MMFWGLVLEPSKSYAQIVDTPFHVSMAALDLKNSDNQEEASTLVLRQDNTEYVLANLSKKHKIFNTVLGLDFDIGEEIEFFVQGQSQIHLTGFLAGDDADDLDDLNEEEDEDEENDIEKKLKDIKKAEGAKRKLKQNSPGPAKKQKILDESFNDDTDDDDFDLDLDDLEDEEDSIEEESDEDDSEDDDEEMDEIASPPKKEQKPQQQQANVSSPDSKNKKKKQKKLLQQQQQQQGVKQANQPQKNQVNQNKTPLKNQQPNKTPQKTPQPKTPQVKTPQTGNKQQNAKSPQGNGEDKQSQPRRKVLKGGIIVEDIAEGTGKVATSNKKVGVYYVGRLASNKKEFDKALSGQPFKFNLGRGEVIRGWDLGVDGMREGGKRKIIVPAKFAYGSSGAPPAIPPNSTLEFEVTLVNVK